MPVPELRPEPLAGAEVAEDDRAERHPAPDWSEGRRAGRPLLALTVVGLVLVSVVVVWTNAHVRNVPRDAPLTGNGVLVYMSDIAGGGQRLWRWDLATGKVARGPLMQGTTELVDAYQALPGWIGVTSRLPDGRQQASVLRFLGPDDAPVSLATGDLVAWSAHGQSVAVLRRGPLADRCHREVSILLVNLVLNSRERPFHDDSLCGDVLSVGRAFASTYFTLEKNGQAEINFAGNGDPHPVLEGYSLISISAASDMIVTPGTGRDPQTIAPVRTRASEDPPMPFVHGAGLFWRGRPDQAPVAYGTAESDMRIERVLAWSPDALHALVAGSVGQRQGLFLIEAGPGETRRVPIYVGPVLGLTYGAITDEGTVLVVTDGSLFSWIDGVRRAVRLPEGAPAPTGPLVWTS